MKTIFSILALLFLSVQGVSAQNNGNNRHDEFDVVIIQGPAGSGTVQAMHAASGTVYPVRNGNALINSGFTNFGEVFHVRVVGNPNGNPAFVVLGGGGHGDVINDDGGHE